MRRSSLNADRQSIQGRKPAEIHFAKRLDPFELQGVQSFQATEFFGWGRFAKNISLRSGLTVCAAPDAVFVFALRHSVAFDEAFNVIATA